MTDTTGSDQPPQRIISLEVAMRKAAEDEFWAIRGKAVQAYANLEKTKAQLLAFIDKCDFYARLVNMFYFVMFDRAPQMPEAVKQTWLDVFSRRAITYPPPADHPLSQMPQSICHPA